MLKTATVLLLCCASLSPANGSNRVLWDHASVGETVLQLVDRYPGLARVREAGNSGDERWSVETTFVGMVFNAEFLMSEQALVAVSLLATKPMSGRQLKRSCRTVLKHLTGQHGDPSTPIDHVPG